MKKLALFCLLCAVSLFLGACSQSKAPSAPVLDRVELTDMMEDGVKKIGIAFYFKDADGDAVKTDFEVVSTTREGIRTGDGTLTKGEHQKTLHRQQSGSWNCGKDLTYEAEISLTIIDEKDLKSEAKIFKLICD